MRVLLLNYEYPPNGGGAGVATEMLARARRPGCRRRCRDRRPLGLGRGDDGVTVHRVRCRRTALHQAGMLDAASYLLAALPEVRRLVPSTGTTWPTSSSRCPPARCSRCSISARCPSWSRSGAPTSRIRSPQSRSAAAHRVLRPLRAGSGAGPIASSPVCESLGRLALRTWPDLDYTVMPNGVDLDRFHPPAERARPPGRVRCLAVARLSSGRGSAPDSALALLERGRFELEIVGSGPGRARAACARRDAGRRRATSPSAAPSTGPPSRGAIGRRTSSPSPPSAEAFGNVFAEALASGCPSWDRRRRNPELVEHGANGLLVAPGDPAALAEAIRTLAEDPIRRRAWAERNRGQAEAAFDWDTSRPATCRCTGMPESHPVPALVPELPSGSWYEPARVWVAADAALGVAGPGLARAARAGARPPAARPAAARGGRDGVLSRAVPGRRPRPGDPLLARRPEAALALLAPVTQVGAPGRPGSGALLGGRVRPEWKWSQLLRLHRGAVPGVLRPPRVGHAQAAGQAARPRRLRRAPRIAWRCSTPSRPSATRRRERAGPGSACCSRPARGRGARARSARWCLRAAVRAARGLLGPGPPAPPRWACGDLHQRRAAPRAVRDALEAGFQSPGVRHLRDLRDEGDRLGVPHRRHAP